MDYVKVIMEESDINRALSHMATRMMEDNPDVSDVAIIGIQRRGVPLSKRLVERIAQTAGVWPNWGSIDIDFYTDDLTTLSEFPIVKETNILFPLRGRHVILVDDVLYTGRTIWVALNAILEIGRPKSIQLAVLIDRGHHELPIRADYVGKTVATDNREIIEVHMREIDGTDDVLLLKPKE